MSEGPAPPWWCYLLAAVLGLTLAMALGAGIVALARLIVWTLGA